MAPTAGVIVSVAKQSRATNRTDSAKPLDCSAALAMTAATRRSVVGAVGITPPSPYVANSLGMLRRPRQGMECPQRVTNCNESPFFFPRSTVVATVSSIVPSTWVVAPWGDGEGGQALLIGPGHCLRLVDGDRGLAPWQPYAASLPRRSARVPRRSASRTASVPRPRSPWPPPRPYAWPSVVP